MPIDGDKEPERYYDWMLWKMRQEDKKENIVSPVFEKGYPSYEAVNKETDLDGGVKYNKTKMVIDQLMYVTAEECGELVQSCMKIARWGINDDKRETLLEEAGDVYCMLQLLIKNGVLTQEELEARASVKVEKLKHYTPIIVKE